MIGNANPGADRTQQLCSCADCGNKQLLSAVTQCLHVHACLHHHETHPSICKLCLTMKCDPLHWHWHSWWIYCSSGSENTQRIATANKARVRMLQCVIMALDRNPVEFAAFLPPFLALYSTNALTAPDAAGVYALPAKRRVLLTTFLARALVCPHYEPDMIKFIKMKGMAVGSRLLWLSLYSTVLTSL